MELIILFSPLLGAIIGGFFWRSIGESQAIYLTIALLFLSCFLSWIVFFSHGAYVEKITLFRWINSGDLAANWSKVRPINFNNACGCNFRLSFSSSL